MSVIQSFNGLTLFSGSLKHAGPCAGQPFKCFVLSPRSLPEVIQLQQDVYSGLSDHEKSFIVPKTAEQFYSFLSGKKGLALGVVTGKRLIAQSLLLFPKSTSPEDSTMTDCPHWPAAPERTAVALSTVVHPDARGNGLQQLLFHQRIKLAQHAWKTHVLCEVAAENPHSWGNVLKSGGVIYSAGVDSSDGTRLLNGLLVPDRSPVLGEGASDVSSYVLSPSQDFERVAGLLNSGAYVGADLAGNGTSLVLRRFSGWKKNAGGVHKQAERVAP